MKILIIQAELGNKKPGQPYGVKPKESIHDKEQLFHARLQSVVAVLSLIATVIFGIIAL